MRQPWQNIFQNCHLQLSAWAAFLNSRKGGGGTGPPFSSPPPLPLPPSLLLPLFPSLNSDLTTVVECNLLLQKPSPPLRMDLFSRHGEGIIWISTIMIGNRNGNSVFGFSCELLFLTKERVTLLFFLKQQIALFAPLKRAIHSLLIF